MRYFVLALFFAFPFFSGLGQIVQPGQIEVVVYPGAQIESMDQLEPRTDSKNEVMVFDGLVYGSVCVNKEQCYDDLRFNVDLLNRYAVLHRDNKEPAYLSFNFLYSLTNFDENTFQLLKTESDDQPMLSEILFKSDAVIFYKKHFVKKLQANYRPEFDTGSKVPTFEQDFSYEFIDELGNHYSFRKINKRILKNSLGTESKVYKEYVDLNKVKDTEDFIAALKMAY